MSEPRLELVDEALDSERAAPLVAASRAEMWGLYAADDPEQRTLSSAGAHEFDPPRGLFLLALEGGQPVACGGLRPVSERRVELKRMYVVPAARRRGLARALLAALEAHAAALGYDEVVLETGDRMEAAIRLYETAGYLGIECFGPYAGQSWSRCYARRLDG